MCLKNYPHNWKKISLTIRRLAHGQCEWCHVPCSNLSVHHIGAPRPNGRGWKKGNCQDKHDVRRENLVALCWPCHSAADAPGRFYAERHRAKKATKRAQHLALGVGTGLVVVRAA
jgi:5-methylcytosine-specific restriction endonuclease McrA